MRREGIFMCPACGRAFVVCCELLVVTAAHEHIDMGNCPKFGEYVKRITSSLRRR